MGTEGGQTLEAVDRNNNNRKWIFLYFCESPNALSSLFITSLSGTRTSIHANMKSSLPLLWQWFTQNSSWRWFVLVCRLSMQKSKYECIWNSAACTYMWKACAYFNIGEVVHYLYPSLEVWHNKCSWLSTCIYTWKVHIRFIIGD